MNLQFGFFLMNVEERIMNLYLHLIQKQKLNFLYQYIMILLLVIMVKVDLMKVIYF